MTALKRYYRTSSDCETSDGEACRNNVLAFVDHGMFAMRPPGGETVLQYFWVYEHPVDLEELRRLHRNLGRGLLGRRIERSPLPFARHRWVSDPGPEIDIAERARPRAELSIWADERAQLPINSEAGPGWRLSVAPFTDGSTAVSLEASHFVIDGVGLLVAVTEAIQGRTRDLGYPPPRSRTNLQAVAEDVRQTARDVPEIARALVAATRMARRRPRGVAPKPSADQSDVPVDGDDEVVFIPGLTLLIDLNDWDECAERLGGTSAALLAGLAARIADRMGRRGTDGAVTVQLPVNERTEADTRANALSFVRIRVDPSRVTTDLRDVRGAVREALKAARESSVESSETFPLALLMSRRAIRRIAATADPEYPVVCSHLGDIDPIMCRIDGTEAEIATGRAFGQDLTRHTLEQLGGVMGVQLWRIRGKASITIHAYQPGADNTKQALQQVVWHTLSEFGLTGIID